MVLVGHLGELLEAHPIVLVGVPHPGLGENARHGLSAENAVDRRHGAVATRRLVDLGFVLGAAPQQAHLAHLLHANSQAHLGLPGLDGQIDSADGRGSGGARVSHVEHGDPGLPDLLLDPLTHARLGLEQRPGAHHVHVVDGHPAVSQRI